MQTSKTACWASWADCLAMVNERHPQVADLLVEELEGLPQTSCLAAAASAARELICVRDFDPPSWHALAQGVRHASREPEEHEPGCTRDGWHHEAASRVELHFRDSDLFARIGTARTALLRSQGGPGAGWHCPHAPRAGSQRSRPNCSGWFSFADSAFPFP